MIEEDNKMIVAVFRDFKRAFEITTAENGTIWHKKC
jgi:hypothetical protein